MEDPVLVPFGDAAWRTSLPEEADARAVLEQLRAVQGVEDVVVSEGHVLVVASRQDQEVKAAVEVALSRSRATRSAGGEEARLHEIAVRYDGPDLVEIGRTTGLSIAEVISLHSGAEYVVAAVGFLPGFAYLRGLHPRLVVPRRSTPRPRVAPLSVAIAGPYTGVYPVASPGGWNLLGTAEGFVPFDAAAGARLSLGDRVRFVSREV
jgi:UPF0271 protein